MMLDGVLKKLVPGFFGVAIIIQLFIYSFGAQLIMDKSTSVIDDFYDTDKDFVLIIARGQKPTTIESGFYKADLETFSKILGNTASLITLLQSFLE